MMNPCCETGMRSGFTDPSILDRRSGAEIPGARTPRLMSGTLHATAAVVWIDPGIIKGWLPPGLRFPDDRPDPHPLTIIWGHQDQVTAFPRGGRFPLPWTLNYSEIITAVPDLRLDQSLAWQHDGPVTYLPRLYMNSWRAALLGRAFYGFSKAYARIDVSENHYRAVDRRGRPLLTVNVERRSSPRAADADCHGLFKQPVALPESGRLVLARFETTLSEAALKPVSLQIDVQPALLSYLPEIRGFRPGIDQQPDGAFEFSADWSLMRVE